MGHTDRLLLDTSSGPLPKTPFSREKTAFDLTKKCRI